LVRSVTPPRGTLVEPTRDHPETAKAATSEVTSLSFPARFSEYFDSRGVRRTYGVSLADRAGNSMVTIFLDDLDAHVTAIAARGLERSRTG